MAVATLPFAPARAFVARDAVGSHTHSFLRLWEVRTGTPEDREFRRWKLFHDLLRADDMESGTLRPAYMEAMQTPGRWIATAPVIGLLQVVPLLLGLPVRSREPQMAVRWHADLLCLDLAPDAEAVMPGRAMPRWRDIIRNPWRVE